MRSLLAAFLLFSAPAASMQTSSNPELEREVRNALATAGFDLESITVSTRGGTVVLRGEVRDVRAKLLAIETAFGVAAVQEVETALELEDSVTPEAEEEVWFVVLQEGLDEGIDRIFVEDGIARVEAPTIDEDRRERLKSVLERVPRVTSVTFDSASVLAEASAAHPPPPQSQTVVEAITAPVEPLPTETLAAEDEVAEADESRDEPSETFSETPPPAEPEAAASEIAEVEVPEPVDPPMSANPVLQPESAPDVLETPEANESREVVTVEPSQPFEAEAPEPVPSTPESPSSRPPAPPTANSASTSDIELAGRDIVEQILTYPDYTVFDHIQIGLQPGAVRIVGFVTEVAKKEEIEARVARVAGSLRIENEIRILVESSGDDTLRKRLFQRIYQNPTFAASADSENPPVHIIVEGGGVILTGVVDRKIDATVAETIARNTFGVRRVENRLRVTTSIASP